MVVSRKHYLDMFRPFIEVCVITHQVRLDKTSEELTVIDKLWFPQTWNVQSQRNSVTGRRRPWTLLSTPLITGIIHQISLLPHPLWERNCFDIPNNIIQKIGMYQVTISSLFCCLGSQILITSALWTQVGQTVQEVMMWQNDHGRRNLMLNSVTSNIKVTLYMQKALRPNKGEYFLPYSRQVIHYICYYCYIIGYNWNIYTKYFILDDDWSVILIIVFPHNIHLYVWQLLEQCKGPNEHMLHMSQWLISLQLSFKWGWWKDEDGVMAYMLHSLWCISQPLGGATVLRMRIYKLVQTYQEKLFSFSSEPTGVKSQQQTKPPWL